MNSQFGKTRLSRGYLKVYSDKEGNKDKLVHRLIMEPLLNYLESKYPEIIWDVHHKNRNKTDNRFENLQIIPHDKHTSLHKKGVKLSDEHKKNISKSNKGRIIPEEVKIKMRKNHADIRGKNNPLFGKKHSEETKKKMSESKKGLYDGEKNPRYRHDIDTGEILKMYNKGFSIYKISKIMKCGWRTVNRRLKNSGGL